MREIKQSEIKDDPKKMWNEFVDILAVEEFEEGETIIRDASLAFRYDCELQNGGHYIFFENTGIKHASDVMNALELIGAEKQKKVFKEALDVWKSKERKPIENPEDLVTEALEGEFADLDSEYYECLPDIPHYLEAYLEKHKEEIFKFV